MPAGPVQISWKAITLLDLPGRCDNYLQRDAGGDGPPRYRWGTGCFQPNHQS